MKCWPSRFGIHWPINFTKKKLTFLYIFNKKKWQVFPGPFSSLQFCLFFLFFWKYTESSIFWEKFIGQKIPDRDGRGIARYIKKNYFNFKNATKMVTKLGQFTQLGPFSTFQLFKLSKLCYHFWSSFGNGNNLFWYSSNPPPIAVRNSLTN